MKNYKWSSVCSNIANFRTATLLTMKFFIRLSQGLINFKIPHHLSVIGGTLYSAECFSMAASKIRRKSLGLSTSTIIQVSVKSQYLVRLHSLCWILDGHTIHPPIEGEKFLKNGFIICHGISKRCQPDRSCPGRIVGLLKVPSSYQKKGTIKSLVMMNGELVYNIDQEESPPSSIEGDDSDDSPESTVDSNLVSEFYPSPDYHYSFSYNTEFSKICLLGRMFNLSRKHGINTRTTIKKDIETVMIHEYSKNRDPVATQFVDTYPAVAAQVKQGFCSSLKSFFTK